MQKGCVIEVIIIMWFSYSYPQACSSSYVAFAPFGSSESLQWHYSQVEQAPNSPLVPPRRSRITKDKAIGLQANRRSVYENVGL